VTFAVGAGLVAAAWFVADHYGVQFFAMKPEPPRAVAELKLPPQTEVYFLNGLTSQPLVTDEWWSARSDHRLLAYAVFNCLRPNEVVDAMPRQHFGTLLLDLTPTGNHAFVLKDGADVLLANRDKEAKPLVLASSEQAILSLSDSIARVRLAAAEGANSNVPLAKALGITTLIISALATLFVTLQGKVRAVELPPERAKEVTEGDLGPRVRHLLWGPGSWFRWVGFWAIALSITATSLTGLKQVFDPTRILTQNTRTLLDLRQLHQDVILGVECDKERGMIQFNPKKFVAWTAAIVRARAAVIPEYGAYASLDVSGASQRIGPEDGTRGGEDQNRNREGKERPSAAISAPTGPTPAASTTTAPAPASSAQTPTPPPR